MLLTFRSGPMRYRIEAAHWLTERGFGKAPQIVEHMGEDGGPVSVKVIRGEGAPDRTRDAAGRDSRGRFRSGVSGNPARRFQPGTSGNPSGKPKNFSIHQLMAEAIDDNTRDEAVRRVQENLKTRRSVLPTLEFAARLNREIGLGSEDRPPGITGVDPVWWTPHGWGGKQCPRCRRAIGRTRRSSTAHHRTGAEGTDARRTRAPVRTLGPGDPELGSAGRP